MTTRARTSEEWIEIATGRIARRFDPLRIILFGSRARQEDRQDSDVDLLLILPAVEDRRRAAVEIRRLLADIPLAKDIIVTTPGEIERRGDIVGSILRPAVREGRVLYERATN
jgi:uncharacterized protein